MDGDWRHDGHTIDRAHIWLIEQQPDTDLSAAAHRVLAAADAVIYDPALVAGIKPVLPLGCYAEPWVTGSAEPAPAPALAPRALKLACDGWRVAQLITPHPARHARMHQVVTADGCELQIEVIASPDDVAPATIVSEPVGPRHPGEGLAFTANGLAG